MGEEKRGWKTISLHRSHFLSTSRAASTDSWNPVPVLLSVTWKIVSMVRTKKLRACRVCSVDTTNQLPLGGRAPQGANSPLFSEVGHPPQAQVGQGKSVLLLGNFFQSPATGGQAAPSRLIRRS